MNEFYEIIKSIQLKNKLSQLNLVSVSSNFEYTIYYVKKNEELKYY